MKYFEHYFSGVNFDGAEEVKVLCPFHSDTKPSASINTQKNLFHCWVCDKGYNEEQFAARVNGISLSDAKQVITNLETKSDSWSIVEEANLWADSHFLTKVEELGLSHQTIQDLHLGLTKDSHGNKLLGIPVYYDGAIMDVRKYNLLKIPKVPKLLADEGAQSGYVIPYDIWKHSKETTYILEGEKDMMLARELGLNAITLTGGAGAKVNDYVINAFKDKDVIICYDNDEAGRSGMDKLYLQLRNVAKKVQYINIGDVVKETKEDFYDFIVKYEKDIFDFLALPMYDFTEVEEKKYYTKLITALNNNLLKRELTSQVIVSAEYSDSFAVPFMAEFEKGAETGAKHEMMVVGEKRNWFLKENNIQQILELIEVGAKKEEVLHKIKHFCGISSKEPNVKSSISDFKTVFKTKIMDKDSEGANTSIDLYSFEPMIVGKQYEVVYKIYPHPTKHQKIVAVATKTSELDSKENFKPNHKLLKEFIFEGTIEEKLNKLYQSAKHHVAKHLNYDLWLMTDLVFNSILEFDYGDRIRGALDVFVLGDTQVGKSETSQKLVDLYSFGHFLSLKTSTTIGLIGGSNKVDGSWLNTIGAIPRQHKKLAVLEEFSGAKPEFIKTMTDIRSSGNLRLARAAGEMNVPCRLRMITISNPLNDENGSPRHLSTFPNGVIPIMELVKSAEDVARYDGFLLVEKPRTRFNPFRLKLEGKPIPVDSYIHKAQWVETRKPENVVFEEGTESYIWQKAEELNALFESNFPLFTTTTALKLARFAVAMASLLVNTDETMEQVIVSNDIVDGVVSYLIKIYDNEVFKLREYKEEYDSYSTLTSKEQAIFQSLYSKNSTVFEFLGHQSLTSRNNLQTISGLDRDGFGKVFNKLVRYKFVRLSKETVYPTQKFRLAMGAINKGFTQDVADTLIEGLEEDGDDGYEV